jgi:hypothetical protein
MRGVLKSFVLLAAMVAPMASSAQAASEDIKGFWQKGDATNWRGTVTETSSASVVYRDYPLVVDMVKEQQPAPPTAQNTENTPQNQPQAQQPPVHEPAPSREQIIARYGSPEQFTPIRAQKEAPLEMQGLFAALNAGDKELAWQYSVALARRNTEMQNMVAKATDYQLLAMESLGMRAPSSLDEGKDDLNQNRVELRELMAKTQQQELQRKLDIEQMLEQQGELAANETAVGKIRTLAPKIPVDPEGKVKVLIFFDEKDAGAPELVKSLTPLKTSFKENQLVSFVGLTKRSYALPALKQISAASSFPFPLLNGEALAQELRIQSYPTIVFLAVTTKETYRLEGLKTPAEVEQVVRLMQGQR